jgi:eukaryotic-like serine/threonine-protein kinase
MKGNFEQLVGRTLGQRYRLERAIGAGGMGAVFEATQLDLGRTVAVKVLVDVDPRRVARLRQEAMTAGSLSCPHVVSIFDFQAPPDERPFIVMELLPGHSLAQLLTREPMVDVPRAARIAAQMLIGLEAAHRAEIVHRDVKPSNTWLVFGPGIDEHVKLLDFGIAKMLGEGASFLTTAGAVLGTPAYLAPEQVRGFAIDARVDIHAMGVVLYEMLAGRRPYQGQGPEFYAEILERVPAPLHQTAPHVPYALSQIVARALAKDPAARFARAADMRVALDPFAGNPSALPPTVVGGFVPAPDPRSALSIPAPSTVGGPTQSTMGTGTTSTVGQAAPALGCAAPPGMHVPPPRSSNLALVFMLSGALVLLAGAGLVIAFLLGRGHSGATTDAGPPAPAASVAVASTVAAVAAGAPSSALPRAGGRPAAASGARTVAAAAVPPSARCECETSRGGTICVATKIPRCTCRVGGSSDLCPEPFPAVADGVGECPVPGGLQSYSAAGRKNGEPCTGFMRTGGTKSAPASGVTSCSFCYGHDKFASTDGSACRGTVSTGETVEGKAVCDK